MFVEQQDRANWGESAGSTHSIGKTLVLHWGITDVCFITMLYVLLCYTVGLRLFLYELNIRE